MVVNPKTITVTEFADLFNCSEKSAEWWLKNWSDEEQMDSVEVLTSRCRRCNKVMQVYDSINWRLKPHPIRCLTCVEELWESGQAEDYTWSELRYVE